MFFKEMVVIMYAKKHDEMVMNPKDSIDEICQKKREQFSPVAVKFSNTGNTDIPYSSTSPGGASSKKEIFEDGLRPRELLAEKGPAHLTTSQLLAIILRTGNRKEHVMQVADRLYRENSLIDLSKSGVHMMAHKMRIGKAQSCQIIASIELGKRLVQYENRPIFTRPSEVAYFLIPELSGLSQEHFKVLYLNNKNRLIFDKVMFVGTSNESLVEPTSVLREAILHGSTSFILAHNHPSGDPTPSENDIQLTIRIQKASRLIGIELFDHIIIGDNSFISLAEKGLIPE